MKAIIFPLVLMFFCISIFADINTDLLKAAQYGNLNKVKVLLCKELM